MVYRRNTDRLVALSNTELGKSLGKAQNYTRKADTEGTVYD